MPASSSGLGHQQSIVGNGSSNLSVGANITKMNIENQLDEVLKWTRNMNSLNLEGYLNDWIEHYCFIKTETQIDWYNVTGRIPTPHYGGYWISYEYWREIKKKILKLCH